MNPLVSLGNKAKLSISNMIKLPNYINPNDQSEYLISSFSAAPPQRKISLLKTLILLNWKYLFLSGILKLFRDFLAVTQPLLLGLLINFLANYSTSSSIPISHGYFYAFSMFFVSLFLLLLNQHYKNITNLTTISVRATLIPAVYTKTLSLRSDYFLNSSVGKITSLMSSDASRVSSFFDIFHLVWSIPFQIVFTLYLLYKTIGVSAFVGLVVIVLSIPINSKLIKKAMKSNRSLTIFKDERIKLISEMISNIKIIKMFSWEAPMLEKITHIRNDKELAALKKYGVVSSAVFFVFGFIPHLVSLFTIGFYALFDNSSHGPLNAELIFVSLSFLNNMRFSLTHAPMIFSSFIEIFYAQERLEVFFTQPDFESNRNLNSSSLTYSTNLSKHISNHTDSETSLISSNIPNYSSIEGNDQLGQPKNSKYSLIMQNTKFFWDNNSKFKLSLDLKLNKGECVGVIGPIGSGKSSFISSIVGEMIKESGNMQVNGSVAYAPQSPWIMNSTLRDNITFGNHYDENLYNLVLEACELVLDISTLPSGDQTEIGERGVNLSGGQKARVSMARAIYSKPDIILFDDTLSALDASVGKRVFERVIGHSGILGKSTRIVVTHSMKFISKFDRVLILKDGVLSANSKYSKEMDTMLKEMKFLNPDEDYIEESGSKDAMKPLMPNSKLNIRNTLDKISENQSRIPKLIATEESQTGSVSWSTFINFLKGCGLWNVYLAIFFLLLTSISAIFANFTLKHWADSNKIKSSFNQSIYNSSAAFLLTYAFFGILSSVSSSLLSLTIRSLCAVNSGKKTHSSMLIGIINSPMQFFNSTPQGRIINRFSSDQTAIDHILPNSFVSWASSIMGALSSIVVISYSFPEFIVFTIPLILVYLMVQEYYLHTSRQLKRISSTLLSPIYSHFTESIAGITTIRSFLKQEMFKKQNIDSLNNYLSADLTFKSLSLWQSTRIESLGAIIVLFSSLLGVIHLQNFNYLDSTLAALTIVYALQFTNSLSRSVESYCTVETNLISIERVYEYSDLPSEFSTDDELGLSYRTCFDASTTWPSVGEIEVKSLVVRYMPHLEPAIKGINFKIKAGEKIGVVGRTGSGKSTLASVLFRLIDQEKGSITIDKVDTKSVNLSVLRNGISIIPQEPFIFSGTLRYNLDPMNQYNDGQLWDVIEMVNLKEIVDSRSLGLEMNIINDGLNLSAGQKQLVCLARVLLKKSKILILDEATASVDLATESILTHTIGNAFSSSTVITIAHRLENIINCDKLMYLDNGNLIEVGNPMDLLKNKDSHFYKLYNKS
ncbi:Metal resistance protein YCF1 [Smittium culicis]|uniref:Metal resistance protein YCF1 n=1 Tax=Smittium culicis TaxID=133412 RepID=A0A1R1Y0J7_9FUNG|nr:Metal resistance protein YCF1 [Smittium culicis]